VAINVGIGCAARTRDNRSFVVSVIFDVTDGHVKVETYRWSNARFN